MVGLADGGKPEPREIERRPATENDQQRDTPRPEREGAIIFPA